MMQALDHPVYHRAEVLTASIENSGYTTHCFFTPIYPPKRADTSILGKRGDFALPTLRAAQRQ